MFTEGRSPVGGGSAGHVKWRKLGFPRGFASHFQPISWKWTKSREATIFRFPTLLLRILTWPGPDATDAVEVEEFSTEYEGFGRARELLEDGDHGGVSVHDSSGNVPCGVRLQLKLGFFGE
jgi:hypothetical protein